MTLSNKVQQHQQNEQNINDISNHNHSEPTFITKRKNKNVESISATTSTTDLNSVNAVVEEEQSSSVAVMSEKQPSFSIIDFSDEILLKIFLNLDTLSLLAVGQTCTRLNIIIQDYYLWENIDLTGEQLLFEDIKNNLSLMNRKTKSIKIRGMVERYPRESWRNISLNKNLLQHIAGACESLQILELHHCLIDTMTKNNEFFMQIDITYFPRNLKRLVFNDCYVCWPNTLAFLFCGIDSHLKSLEDLRIEFCNWFSAHDLLSFSKISNLKHLSIRGCSELKEFVPYGNIAIRFGFKNLELLDLRETPITDTDFSYFNKLKNLRELLVECPAEPRLKLENSEISAGCVVNSTYNVRDIENEEKSSIRNYSAQDVDTTYQALGTVIDNIAEENERAVPQSHELSHSWEMIHASGIYVSMPKITDRGVCSFGISRSTHFNILNNIGIDGNRTETKKIYCTTLEKLTIRNYDNVSDISLRHLSLCAPKLKYLDITGCGITCDGLKAFKNLNIDCKIKTDIPI